MNLVDVVPIVFVSFTFILLIGRICLEYLKARKTDYR